jgi:hypothetical protein
MVLAVMLLEWSQAVAPTDPSLGSTIAANVAFTSLTEVYDALEPLKGR